MTGYTQDDKVRQSLHNKSLEYDRCTDMYMYENVYTKIIIIIKLPQ